MTPLSQSQKGIFYACTEAESSGENYQLPFLYSLPPEIDTFRLKKALEAFIDAHPYVCSRIVMDDTGQPCMTDGAKTAIKIFEVESIEDVRGNFCRAMDLLSEPLVRFEIYKTPAGNYFYCDFHHIILDASSFNAFADDLGRCYETLQSAGEILDGGAIALEEEKMRSGESFKLEREWYMNTFSAASELDCAPVASNIELEGEGSAERNFRLKFSKEDISAICSRYGVGKSVVFTAAWGKLLADYSAQDKVFFATIYNDRYSDEVKSSITMMVRTLPVYMELSQEKPLDQWLQDVKEQQEQTRDKRAYSFSDLHQDLELRADMMFAYQGRLASNLNLALGGKTASCEDLRTARPGITLDGQLFEVPADDGGYMLRISYRKNLYSKAMVENMAESFETVVNSMKSAACIRDIELSSSGQKKWLDATNPEFTGLCTDTVLDMFKERVREKPDSICCVSGIERYTYRQIDEITDSLAARIQDTTGGKKKVVSFVAERNSLMVIFPLSIVKAGCTYQPLDSSYPKDRLQYMVEDANSCALLTPSAFVPSLDFFKGEIIALDKVSDIPVGRKPSQVEVLPEDIFILLYTSGTTGKPKGVMLTNRGIRSFVKNNRNILGLDSSSRIASYASCGFDMYLMDLWGTLTCGAQINIISEDIRYDLVAIHDYYLSEKITHSVLTTQIGTQMAINFPDISGLKFLGVGGEKLSSVDAPDYPFVNMYGPTESTIYVTYCPVLKNERNIPIGRAIGDMKLYVVNKSGKRVPMGAAGELWVSGPQLALGYLGLKEKTAESFISNPFDKDPLFTRVYRTGDIVRYREDGMIEFIGRKDGQVKIRGFRIELKEVEAVIRNFPGIKEVTVQAFDVDDAGKALAAYIVADTPVDIRALNEFIAQTKPPYMVPAATMQIDRIPLNFNGKVDKKQLPKPQINVGTKSGEQGPAAPLNFLERQLKELVSKASGCDDFSITTPLKYVGLTSISSLHLSVELYKNYGVNISSKELVKDYTLQEVENRILETFLSSPVSDIPSKEKEDTAKETYRAPLSNAQIGVYYECLKNPDSTVYNVPTVIRFPSSVTETELQRAVSVVLNQHPLLFARIDASVDPPLMDASAGREPRVIVSAGTREEIASDFVKPFDLASGPLYRAVVCGSTLFFDAHHLVMDGSSLSLVLHQICDAIEGKIIEPEDCSYFKFARMENASDMSAAEAFYNERLSGVEDAITIPADKHSLEENGREAESFIVVNHGSVEAFAKAEGITPAAVYLAALEYVAARYANTRDVCLCMVSSGRGDMSISGTVGMFVNTLALTGHIDGGTVGEFVRKVSENMAGALEHENYPFAKIADRFGLDPGLVFVYQLGVIDRFEVRGEELSMSSLELSAPKFKISLLVENKGEDIALVAKYNDAIYSEKYIDSFLESLGQVVSRMTESPALKIASLSIMTPEQRRTVEEMGFLCKADIPVPLFHGGIERWALLKPSEPAFIASDCSLTYREFDLKANVVANSLIDRGLKKGDAVVLLLPRDSRILVCIQGVMKAGGAFIPCDPEYPSDRIRLIAEDSGARFVVTTESRAGEYSERGVVVDDLLRGEKDKPCGVCVEPDDLAYMIYTSGSTGRPKGVAVTHRNITTYIGVSPEHPLMPVITRCSRMCTVATISFDAFINDYGHCLYAGKTLVFSNEEESKDPFALSKLMTRTNADYMCCTSSRMLQYLELPSFRSAMKNVNVVILGGEAFPQALLRKLEEINPDMDILNGYGPTEVSISCNSCRLNGHDTITVGKPIPNYWEWIMDKDGNELPVGVTGELVVGGQGVTLGYVNLPEKTSEKYYTYKGMRAFRTGDYARWCENGEVMILGRADNQVKLRGLRIELGEVESAVSQVPGVQAVHVRICNIGGREHLSAYFVADHKIDIGQMKEAIGRTLTSYMVPTAYLQMDAFPISPNGKIDFRHLPEPHTAQSSMDYVKPANDVEKFFAEMFAGILQIDKVGATDSFFSLGGTSLVVMKVVIEAQAAGYKLTYSDVFDHPSPRELASLFVVSGEPHKEADPDADVKDYDYSDIEGILGKNCLEEFMKDSSPRPLGNVLLTGATGFLGIHILRCLLEDYPDSRIHCLLRAKKGVSAGERLNQMYFYYFEKSLEDDFGTRVNVHEGDVTDKINVGVDIDTVINCAAVVKHFASGTIIEDVNVGGVRNCIDFCLEKKARLVQISTYSVGGASVNGVPDVKAFNERMLYLGQRIHNQYVHSKIIAERLLLEAVATRGLDGKIMRVGNLSARSDDGEFQINVKANSFMGRLNVFQMLGVLPYSSYPSLVEFSPIDETARAICLLAQTAPGLSVFHPYNSHSQMLGDVLAQMKVIGREVRLVENEEYVRVLNEAKKDSGKQEKLSSMLAYEIKESDDFIQTIQPDNDYTIQVLLRMGFCWDPTSWDYMDKFLRQIDSLQYFDEQQ